MIFDGAAGITRLFEDHGLVIIFVILLLEPVPFLGLVIPGFAALVAAGFFLDGWPLLAAIILCYGAVVIADSACFWLGRAVSVRWADRVGGRAAMLVDFSSKPGRGGFFYPFLPCMRMIVPLSLGSFGMKWQLWLRLVLPAAGCYVGIGIGLGYGCHRLAYPLQRSDELVIPIILFALLWIIIALRRNRRS